jgi:uncharacterized protein
MHAIVEQRRAEIADLCRLYRVKRLDVFGSAATGTFDPASSDIDFLVEFEELPEGTHADTFFGLLGGLRDLFKRKVDLVTATSMTNRFFIKSVYATREAVYG